jgi:hypothetical protein
VALKDAGRPARSFGSASVTSRGAGSDRYAPVAVDKASAKSDSADNLLKVISLQSNPSHGGGFSGLAGMRQLRDTETVASLNRISEAQSQPAIPQEEDKPENSLGEISVGVSRSH